MASKGFHHNNRLNYSKTEHWHQARPLQTAECVWKLTHTHTHRENKREFGMTIKGDLEVGVQQGVCCHWALTVFMSFKTQQPLLQPHGQKGVRLKVCGMIFFTPSVLLRLRLKVDIHQREAWLQTDRLPRVWEAQAMAWGAAPKKETVRKQSRFLNSQLQLALL